MLRRVVRNKTPDFSEALAAIITAKMEAESNVGKTSTELHGAISQKNVITPKINPQNPFFCFLP
jgi:hypothetical protein